MIPTVEDCYFYSRENNILIANLTDGTKKPLVKFHHKFIDVAIMSQQGMEYTKRFMEMHPHLWEYIEEEPKINQQLTFF